MVSTIRTRAEIIGDNFRMARKIVSLSMREVAKLLKVTHATVGNFEHGRGKTINENFCKKYFSILMTKPGFPEFLTIDDFLSKHLVFEILGESPESPEEAFSGVSPSELKYHVDKDISEVATQPKDEISKNLQEFLNDELEMAVANPSSEEIKALAQLKPTWDASKDFYRCAIGDMRRSRSISKRKAAGASGQSSAG